MNKKNINPRLFTTQVLTTSVQTFNHAQLHIILNTDVLTVAFKNSKIHNHFPRLVRGFLWPMTATLPLYKPQCYSVWTGDQSLADGSLVKQT